MEARQEGDFHLLPCTLLAKGKSRLPFRATDLLVSLRWDSRGQSHRRRLPLGGLRHWNLLPARNRRPLRGQRQRARVIPHDHPAALLAAHGGHERSDGRLGRYGVTGATPGRLRVQADGVVVADISGPAGRWPRAMKSITGVAQNLVNGQAAGLDAPRASQRMATGEPVVFGVAPCLPDFVVNGLQAATTYPQPEETVLLQRR